MTLDPNPYVDFPKDRRGVLRLWERFHVGLLDREAPCTPYQRMLMADWQRCSALGIDASMQHGRRLSGDAYERCRIEQRRLLDVALPILRDVGHFLAGVPGILILTERTGTVLHIDGDAGVQERAATLSGIVVGSRWNESTAGTNGVGTALSRRQPVHVYASEHYCEGWHTWSCAAAPILDREGREVLGVVDFTTVETDFRDQALGLSVSLANSIQARLALEHELERRRVLMDFGEAARRYPHDDLIAFDRVGQPIAQSPNERCRAIAARWHQLSAGEATEGVAVRERLPVHPPDSVEAIGSIVVLERPAGYQRVFRADAAAPTAAGPRSTPAPTAAAVPTVRRFGDFATADDDTCRMLGELERLAAADVNLLLIGETGTGKELLARHLHACSPRAAQPYLAVNCGAISEPLMESSFFGYVKGAYSGADPRGRAGYFETAAGGTLFLDEIGELPLAMQAALLRVLEDGSYQRVGSCQTLRAGCRIVAATHRDLESLIESGRFRRDLYYRLKIVERRIKPLRERPGTHPLLAAQILDGLRVRHHRAVAEIAPAAMAALQRHGWPGNVRELRNALESALLCSEGWIDTAQLPPELRPALVGATEGVSVAGAGTLPEAPPSSSVPAGPGGGAPPGLASVRAYERELLIAALRRHRRVGQVAGTLGIARSTLYRKFTELGIEPSAHLGRDAAGSPG